MFNLFSKRKAWKPIITMNEKSEAKKKFLLVFCGSEERGTSTIADYYVRAMSRYEKVCVIDVSESRSFYMKYIFDEKLSDEEMSEALIKFDKNINKPLEFFKDCFLYTLPPFDKQIIDIDFVSTITNLFKLYNYIVVDMSNLHKEILNIADLICVVSDTNILKCFKDKMYLKKICENLDNLEQKKDRIHIVFNKVSSKFINTQLMIDIINNKSKDIYYSNIDFEFAKFLQVAFLEKIYKNPLGLVNLGNSRNEKTFKNDIESLIEAFSKECN